MTKWRVNFPQSDIRVDGGGIHSIRHLLGGEYPADHLEELLTEGANWDALWQLSNKLFDPCSEFVLRYI